MSFSAWKYSLIVFRLKLMQIISLVSNDGLMAGFNISIPTDDLIERLGDFISMWHYESYPRYQTYTQHTYANFTEKYEVNLTQVINRNGFCYTFNFPNAS